MNFPFWAQLYNFLFACARLVILVVMIYVALRFFDLLSPYDVREQIFKGRNIAAGIVIASIIYAISHVLGML